MTIKERTTIRLKPKILKLLNEKCQNVNLSLLMNNALDYILLQDEEFIREFSTKKPQ